MRVLITGSAGYLGSKVVSLLPEQGGHEIYGIDIADPQQKDVYASFVKASVTNPYAMEEVFKEAKPDVAIHLAFVVNALHDESKEEEVALKGSENFLYACSQHQVKKIIFMSSASAYGAHSDSKVPYTETSSIRGNESYPYSRLKAMSDRMAVMFMRHYKDGAVVILRPCLFIGPHTDNSFFEMLKFPFFPQIVDKGVRRDPEFQFIHEDDMASCVVASIEKEVSGIFNNRL